MGQALIDKLLPRLAALEWPADPHVTELGRIAYMDGLEKVDEFRGQPANLVAALRTFVTADSYPYAAAGTAYTLVAASAERDGSYAPAGLEAAMTWLEKAQEHEPDHVDINFIEALIYIHGGRLDDARLVLDYLQQQDPRNYLVDVAEIEYWHARDEHQNVLDWCERAAQAADTVPRRLRVQSRVASTYMRMGRFEQALETYRKARHFDPDNVDIIYQMSRLTLRAGDIEEAERLAARALELRDFPNGHKLMELIKQKKREAGTGRLGRFFGRS